jgi:hypothetical protein
MGFGNDPDESSRSLKQVSKRNPFPSGHIVDLARRTGSQQRKVGSHHVTHIEQISNWLQISRRHFSVGSGSNREQPFHKGRYHISRGLAWPGMGKGTRHDHRELHPPPHFERGNLGPHLACGVG